MKEKITNAFVTLLLIAVAVGCGWLAVEMFSQGAWIKGILCMLGVLLFGAPLLVPLFSAPASQEPQEQLQVLKVPLPQGSEALLDLARQVAGDDEHLMRAVEESLEAPETFYRGRVEADIEDRYNYFELWDAHHDNPEMLRREGLLNVLAEMKAVVMFDWKDSLETFVDEMQELRRVQRHHLPIAGVLPEGCSNIPHWCHALNEQWLPLGYQTMLVDTLGDEYWVGIVPVTGLEAAAGKSL